MAHCNRNLNGIMAYTTPIPTQAPVQVWAYTPPDGIGFDTGLACTVGGQTVAGASIRCTGTDAAVGMGVPTPTPCACHPYLFALPPSYSAAGLAPTPTAAPRWTSCLGTGLTSPCLLDPKAWEGVPLIDSLGTSYASDDTFLSSFNAQGTPNPSWVGSASGSSPTPQVGQVNNPTGAAIVSWNLTDDPLGGYLVGQGEAGILLVVDPTNGQITSQVQLRDVVPLGGIPTTGRFVSTNTASVTGDRVYTVTQFCPDTLSPAACAGAVHYYPGRLYALDVDPTSGVAVVRWYWSFGTYTDPSTGAPAGGPSGASPLVVPTQTAPVGAVIYTDGAVVLPTTVANSTPTVDPVLFAIQDQCPSLGVFPTVTPTDTPTAALATSTATDCQTATPPQPVWSNASPTPTAVWGDDLTQLFGEPNLCQGTYRGITTAFALDPRSTPGQGWIWGSPRCSEDLLQLSAQTGQLTDRLNIGYENAPVGPGTPTATPAPLLTPTPLATEVNGYGPASARLTAPNGPGGDPVLFQGVKPVSALSSERSYLLAVDLATHQLLWKITGVTASSAALQSEVAQYPIAVTGAGNAVLVAPQFDGVVQGFELPTPTP